MPGFAIGPNAKKQLAELPRDKTLLLSVWRQLEWHTEDLRRMERASFPHNPKRLRAEFIAVDSQGTDFHCDAIFNDSGPQLILTAFAFNDTTEYPDTPLPDEFQ